MKYCALLRGINVSGKNKLPMKELTVHLEQLGIKAVQTYIQSGNIVFEATQAHWEEKIKEMLLNKYQYQVPTLVMTQSELEEIVHAHPHQHLDPAFLHITFLRSTPSQHLIDDLKLPSTNQEQCVITSKAVFLHLPNGYGRTKLNNNFFEQKLKVEATTRNWKTCQKLLEMIRV